MILPNNTQLQAGKYIITRFIASGGFGCTYEGMHTMFDTRVAIKEFFPKMFCNRDENTSHVTVATQGNRDLVAKLRKKFNEEAIAIFRMKHDNIVRVLDVFEENGTAYYVMEYVDGKSLNELVKERGALPEAEAVGYIRQVAEALKYVHSLNRLHLDIKPGNIMVDQKGNAILIDFGASKHYDDESGENTSTLLGVNTKGYAPIEQSTQSFSSFSPATDIYALGATLYKLLTGITPPDANLLVIEEETLQDLPSDISSATSQAVSKAMQIRRKNRPQTIEEFLSLIDSPSADSDNIDTEETQIIIEAPKPEVATTGSYEGHEWVDLGLPSGTKWATCNIGASKPEESGEFYSWGEIETKKEYYQADSKLLGKSFYDLLSLGVINRECNLTPVYDAASAKWGKKWRMPTNDDFKELLSYCKWSWISQSEVVGYNVLGLNGNSIFLPASGSLINDNHTNKNKFGYYWSSTAFNDVNSAHDLYLCSFNRDSSCGSRSWGLSIRPVSKEDVN